MMLCLDRKKSTAKWLSLFVFNVYLFLKGGGGEKRERESRGGAEREGDTEFLSAQSQPDVGLEPTNHEIMT